MGDFNIGVPSVTIGGVALPAQNFTWRFTAGVEPFSSTFIVPLSLSTQLENIKNPVSMTIIFPTTTSMDGVEGPSILTVDKLYLVSRRSIDLVNVEWTITDSRWLLQGKKIFVAYNKTLPSKNNVSVYTGSPTDFASLRAYWETLSKGRYVSWTVKPDGSPYTVREIIQKELTTLGMVFRPLSNALTSYVVDNIILDGTDAVKTISEFLTLSKDSLAVTPAGELYIYSVSSYETSAVGPIGHLSRSKVARGCLYAQQKKKGRPSSVRVMFEKKYEVLLVATPETRTPLDLAGNAQAVHYQRPLPVELPDKLKWLDKEEGIKKARIIACVNVVPCPIGIESDGIKYNVGEYVPINVFLKAFELRESNLTDSPWFNGGLELVLSHHFRNIWKKTILTADLIHKSQMIISTIKNHWRRTYQIDPYYLDYIKSWDTRRISVINSYDGRTAPSPVYANHFYIPYARPLEAITEDGWKTSSYSWNVAQDDPNLDKPVPAIISQVNEKLGLFSVNFPKPIDPGVGLIGPFSLTDVPLPSPENFSITLDKCYPTAEHNMFTFGSIVWHSHPTVALANEVRTEDIDLSTQGIIDGLFNPELNPSYGTRSQYHSISVLPPNQAVGEFPPWEVVSTAEFARLPFMVRNDGGALIGGAVAALKGLLDKFVNKDYYTSASPDEPSNSAFLSAVANYEAGRIYNLFTDLFSGELTIPGLDRSLEITGNLFSITYNISPTTGATTTYDFLDVMPYAPIETTLPQRYIDYIRRNLSKGDDISSSHIAN